MSVSRVSDDVRLGYKHPKVQRLRRLISRRDERDTEGVFVAEGYKLLEEGLAAGFEPESVFVAPRHSASRRDAEPAAAMRTVVGSAADYVGRQDDVLELDEGVLERVADTVSPQGVITIFKQRTVALSAATAPMVVLVDVRDPGNAGTILRSAEASGIASVVLTQGSVDVFNPKVVRSSAGAIFNLPIARLRDQSTADLIADLKARGVICIGTVMDAPQSYDQTDLTRPVALFMGNEANGLDPDTLALMDENVSIPIEGRSESLNVSMAASVLCFELARQVRQGPVRSK